VEPPLEGAVFLDQLAMLERLANDPDQLGALERLGQEVDGAILHRLDGFLDRAERRQQDHVHVGRHGLDLPQELEPGETGHLEVRQHEVDAAGAEPLEGGGAVGGQDHGVPLAGQHALEALAHGRIPGPLSLTVISTASSTRRVATVRAPAWASDSRPFLIRFSTAWRRSVRSIAIGGRLRSVFTSTTMPCRWASGRMNSARPTT